MERFSHDGTSLLVSNMAQEASEMETFPLLIGREIGYFHSIEGGYDSKNECHVVNFIHDVQGVGRPNHIDPDQASHDLEAHLEDNYYNLEARTVRVISDYPDTNYVFSAQVDSYRSGEHAFSEALTAPADKRETRHE